MRGALEAAVLALALATAGAAHAQPAPGTAKAGVPAADVVVQGQRTPEPKADQDRIVCREEPVTGSRFVRKVCATQAQWSRQAQEAQDTMDFIHQHSGRGMPMSGPLWGAN